MDTFGLDVVAYIRKGPNVRLCKLHQVPNSSYGFKLYQGLTGVYIKEITSPSCTAALAGLKVGDKLLEVNSCNVVNGKLEAVEELIESIDGHVTFRVADLFTVGYYGLLGFYPLDKLEIYESPKPVVTSEEAITFDFPSVSLIRSIISGFSRFFGDRK